MKKDFLGNRFWKHSSAFSVKLQWRTILGLLRGKRSLKTLKKCILEISRAQDFLGTSVGQRSWGSVLGTVLVNSLNQTLLENYLAELSWGIISKTSLWGLYWKTLLANSLRKFCRSNFFYLSMFVVFLSI